MARLFKRVMDKRREKLLDFISENFYIPYWEDLVKVLWLWWRGNIQYFFRKNSDIIENWERKRTLTAKWKDIVLLRILNRYKKDTWDRNVIRYKIESRKDKIIFWIIKFLLSFMK